MLKVGIFLRAREEMGGTLQYNMAVLAAATLLPGDRYQVVVASAGDYWRQWLQPGGLEHVQLGNTLVSRASAELWGRLRLPVSVWRALAPYWHPLTRIFRRQGCDVWIFPSQDSMAYWIPVTSICAIHDLMHRYEPEFEESAAPALYKAREFLYGNLSRWCAGILVDSPTGVAHMAESYGTDRNRIHSLPFIPPDYIYRTVTNNDRQTLREKYRLPEKFFFYPAQFWKHKNHEVLVRGLHRNLADHPDMRLVFCGGSKNNYDFITGLIGELGLENNIQIIGYIPDADMTAMYHCAQALLMPTFYGPTNIPPLEAMACGCPVAVSRIYGMPEQLGDAALYFDPRSVSEVAAVMTALWSDEALCRKLRDRGAARSARWGIGEFSKRLGEIIDNVTGRVRAQQ
jgi:glycosyltransferase involved in cell wall biosynthesis